jgi:integrase
MRCESEALWLRWEDVDLAEGFLWIASGRGGHRTKSGKGKWSPMTPRLTEAIKAHFANYRLVTYAGEPSAWLFHHEMTRPQHKAGERITSMRHSFASAADRAGLPDAFRQHDLRHRRVTSWLAAGRSAALVQEAMGHSDLRTTLGYSHLARTHLKALVGGASGAQKPEQPAPSEATA